MNVFLLFLDITAVWFPSVLLVLFHSFFHLFFSSWLVLDFYPWEGIAVFFFVFDSFFVLALAGQNELKQVFYPLSFFLVFIYFISFQHFFDYSMIWLL